MYTHAYMCVCVFAIGRNDIMLRRRRVKKIFFFCPYTLCGSNKRKMEKSERVFWILGEKNLITENHIIFLPARPPPPELISHCVCKV